MNDSTEGLISSLAAILVLFTAMLDPRLSIAIAAAALTGLAAYKFLSRRPS
jgi:hypothetical protein